MQDRLEKQTEALESRIAFLPVERLPDIKRDFDDAGIDTSPYYDFTVPGDLGFEPRMIIAAAVKSRIESVVCEAGGRQYRVVIPPAYADFKSNGASLTAGLKDRYSKEGFNIVPAGRLPCKPIAVHAGLGLFGRNNIVYAEGMGSFLNLYLFYTDAPSDSGAKYMPLALMERCASCDLCVRNCPTGALAAGKRLADASRCLTGSNENAGDFPAWLLPEWHHTLIGCLKCQSVCPANREAGLPLSDREPLVRYSEEETAALLDGSLSPEKLAPLGWLADFAQVLPRNLKALIYQQGTAQK